MDFDSRSVRPWTGSTTATTSSHATSIQEIKLMNKNMKASTATSSKTKRIIELNCPSHPTTPWRKNPDEGRHQRKLTSMKYFNELATNGKRYHLRTKLQIHEKKIQKEAKIALAKAKKLAKRRGRMTMNLFQTKTESLNPFAMKQKGVSSYTQALRKGLNNYYHVSVRKAVEDLWIALTLLAKRTGGDEKDLINPPPPPSPSPSPEEEEGEGEGGGKREGEDGNKESILPETNQKTTVIDKHGIGRPLYFRFYRRLFVALRSIQDNLSFEECKRRIIDAEIMANITKRKEKKSKLGLSGFARRSSSGGILGISSGKGGFGALLGAIAKSASKNNSKNHKSRRKSETSNNPQSNAKNRWNMIKKEVCNTMSWKDLLKKRKETRAARAVKAGELSKIQKNLAMKDWQNDSSFFGVEIPLKNKIHPKNIVFDGDLDDDTINNDEEAARAWAGTPRIDDNDTTNSKKENIDSEDNLKKKVKQQHQLQQQQTHQQRDPIEKENSRILKKKRISMESFKESMIIIARHYANSGSAIDFVQLLEQLLKICFGLAKIKFETSFPTRTR